MESAHALAVVCRAKQIVREAGTQVEDGVLGYMCRCSDIDGSWWDLLQVQPPNGGQGKGEDAVNGRQAIDHNTLVKAIERMARNIANSLADVTPEYQLARFQLELETVFRQQQQHIGMESQARVDRIQAKMNQVLQANKARITVQEMNKVYDQVVYFVCMAGRIESALHESKEEQEVRAAMESVFPFSMLAQFITLPRSDKEMQLCELPYIVMGICLFNQATGASEGRALTTALESSLNLDTSTLLKSCEDHVQSITHTLHAYTGSLESLAQNHVRGECLLWFQARTYLQQLHAAIATSINILDKLARELLEMVSEVQTVVREMKAVPKQTILPLFYRIGQHFEATLDEQRQAMVHQVMLEKIQQKIAGFPRSVPLVPGNGLVQAEDAAALATSGETRLLHLEMIGESANATEKATTDKKPVIETGVGKQDPAWGGSDIVVFVRHKGMLLAANESVTQVRYPAEGSWYGFCTTECAEEFKQAPHAYISAAREILLKHPHLIPAVVSTDKTIPHLLSDVLNMGYSILRLDCGTQTPTHFVESHIDPTYEWNEWVLRRKAVALANLETKLTKSCQTARKTFRRDNDTQCWEPKTSSSQTPFNKGQCMPKKLKYVAGLRGDPVTTKMSIVSLELDLGQPHQV